MDATVVLITLIIYKVTLIGIGFWASRRTKTEGDFFLGGRGLGPWVAGLSYAASTSSAWVLLGFSGFVFANGLSALWMVPGIWAGYAVVWLWFGPRLRAEADAHNYVTLTDFLTAKVDGPIKRLIAAAASAFILFCFVFYVAAQFDAAGRAFDTTFHIGVTESVVVGAAIILAYCLLGGFWAVSVTDTLQGAIMAIIAVGLPIVALVAAGGPSGVAQALSASAPEGFLDWSGGLGGFVFLGFVLGVWGVGVGALGQPHLLNRLMAVRDEASRRRGFIVAMSWAVAVYIGMATLALSGRALVGDLGDAENIFYRMTGDLLPSVLGGVVLAAVLSAVMSTVDSILLAAAAAVAHDLGISKRWPKHDLLVARLVMTVIVILAVVITLAVPASIFGRVLFAWSALGAAFGPIVVARVAGVEPRGWAILAAMVSGFALTVFFNQAGAWTGGAITSGPGQVFERVLPWVPALALVFGFRQKQAG